LAGFLGGKDVTLSGPALKVGQLGLSMISDHLDLTPQIPEAGFYHYYIWQEWYDLFFTIDYDLCLYYVLAIPCSALMPSFAP
jgi:hypothetical protein